MTFREAREKVAARKAGGYMMTQEQFESLLGLSPQAEWQATQAAEHTMIAQPSGGPFAAVGAAVGGLGRALGGLSAPAWLQSGGISLSLPAAPEPVVTEEMTADGMAAALGSRIGKAEAESVRAIYRAMHAVAPVELISPAEDALSRENRRLHDAVKERTDERDMSLRCARALEEEKSAALAECAALAVRAANLKAELTALRARVAERDASVAHAIRIGRKTR